jgi:hypothetical protein
MIKLFILSLLSVFGSPDNCDTSPLASECVKQMPKKFHTLKTFNVMKRKEQEYFECSYVLTKGTRYNIGACFNTVDNLKIEVFNSKRSLVASISSEKKYSKLTYKCLASGIYYMRFSFVSSSSNSCGASLLSFAKK